MEESDEGLVLGLGWWVSLQSKSADKCNICARIDSQCCNAKLNMQVKQLLCPPERTT